MKFGNCINYIPRIINRCKEYGLAEPLFEEYGDGFKVTIFRKAINSCEKVVNDPKKVVNNPEKTGIIFKKYISILMDAGVTEKYFMVCGIGVSFGQANIMEWLHCSKGKAINTMKAMKKAKVIRKVAGLGPGRYEFIEL